MPDYSMYDDAIMFRCTHEMKQWLQQEADKLTLEWNGVHNFNPSDIIRRIIHKEQERQKEVAK